MQGRTDRVHVDPPSRSPRTQKLSLEGMHDQSASESTFGLLVLVPSP